MQPVTHPLLVLHPDHRLLERVRYASGERFSLYHVTSWSRLCAALRESAPGALVIVDPYADGSPAAGISPMLRTLLLDFPSATVIATLPIQSNDFGTLRTLGEWGVAEIVDVETDTTSDGLAALLNRVSGQRFRVSLETSVLPHVSGRGRTLILAAADVVSAGGQADDVARGMGVSRRTLQRWCDQAGLPPIRRVMAWLRILLAAEMLDEPSRTITSIAHACGYASDNALRTALQMQLGKGPKMLRREGAFATASQGFSEELRRTRANTGRARQTPEADAAAR